MKRVYVLLIGLVIVASTCKDKQPECSEGSHSGLVVQNNSSGRINFEIYWNYPDTIIGDYNPKGLGVIMPGESRTRGAGPYSCWEAILKEGNKEYIYIFNEDSLEAISWETVRATNRGLLERREISLQYLMDNNFVVAYP